MPHEYIPAILYFMSEKLGGERKAQQLLAAAMNKTRVRNAVPFVSWLIIIGKI